MTRWIMALTVFVALGGTGCSSGGGNDDNGNGNGPGSPGGETCAPDEFSLSGTIDQEPVSYTGTLSGHAWIQGSDPSTFTGLFDGGGRFNCEWQDVVADGDTTEITGSIEFPPGGTHGGQTVNFASGSMRKDDDAVAFSVSGLSYSVQCFTDPCPPEEAEGSVDGCVHWKPPGG